MLDTDIPLEAARRINELLRRPTPAPHPDSFRAPRAVEVLEWIGGTEAKAILTKFVDGDPEAPFTMTVREALGRIK
jgi:hypothetical protein